MSDRFFAPPGRRPWVLRHCDQVTGAQAVDSFQSLTAALTQIVRCERIGAVQPELWVDPAAESEAAATAPLEYRGENVVYLLDLQTR